jgi:hypothetical protein
MVAVLLTIFAIVAFLGARWIIQPISTLPDDVELTAPRIPEPGEVPPDVKFTDITAAAGITHSHKNGAVGERLLPETMGGGVAFLDYDNDQAIDLLFVNGRAWPWNKQLQDPATSSLVLYRGDGTGQFTDTGISVLPPLSLYGMGVAVGDYDADGDVDIFISALGANRLLENLDGRRFREVSSGAGVSGAADAWSTGAAFFDFDRDDDLDLVVLNYVQWSRETDVAVDYRLTGIGRAYGPPTNFAGTYSYIYRNDGDGTFTDVSKEAGIRIDNPATGQALGKGLAVLPVDVNSDGWTDLVIANDTVRNFVLLNNAGAGFEEAGVRLGMAYDNAGAATGAMGIDDAVLGQSMDLAIAIGNFANEMTSFYVQPRGTQIFTDEAIVAGIGPASRRALTFGVFFFDYDIDGRLDLLQANGHVEIDINVVQASQQFAQQPQLFWNCGTACARQFVHVSLQPEDDMSRHFVARGAAYADIDQDGDLDVVLTQIGSAPVLLRNDQETGHNWIQFDILNDNGVAAYGATVELVTSENRQQRRVEPTRSYLSQVGTTLTFGIGNSEWIDYAEIKWLDGRQLRLDDPVINLRHRITPK